MGLIIGIAAAALLLVIVIIVFYIYRSKQGATVTRGGSITMIDMNVDKEDEILNAIKPGMVHVETTESNDVVDEGYVHQVPREVHSHEKNALVF